MLQRTSRHPSILRADDTLLLVVDMQESLLNAVWERDRLLKHVVTLIETSRVTRLPVVPTQQNGERLGQTIADVAKRLPSLCVPFNKMCFSCCDDDALLSEISRSGHKQVLLCGVETHVCIAQSALDLISLGYQVHVAADAVSSRTEFNWKFGLKRMEQAGVVVTSTEAAIFELLRHAGTPEFREILQLVK